MALQYSPKISTDGLILCLDPNQNTSLPLTDLPVKGGLIMWMDANDDSTFSYSSGTTVSQWRDKSGFNYHMTPLSAGPTRNSTTNSRKVLAFTTSQDIQNLTIDLRTSAYSIFVVSRYTNASSGTGRVLTANAGQNNWLLGHWASETNKYYANGWVYQTYAAADTNWKLYLGDWGGSSNNLASFYTSGTALATDSANAGAGPWSLGINANSSERSNCEAAEIIVYNRRLTASERQAVDTYLGLKWGIAAVDRRISDLSGNQFDFNFNGVNPKTIGNSFVSNFNVTSPYAISYFGGQNLTSKVLDLLYNDHTIEVAVNPTDFKSVYTYNTSLTTQTAQGVILWTGRHSGIYFAGSTLYYLIWNSGSTTVYASYDCAALINTVIHIAATRRNNFLSLYINGILVDGPRDTGATAGDRPTYTQVNIGCAYGGDPSTQGYVWVGKHEYHLLRMYEKCLTPTEISNNYLSFKNRNPYGTYNNPASSAVSLKTLVPSAKSGFYYIKPDGYTGNPVRSFCDLETETGGWMHVGTVYDNNEARNSATDHPWGAPLNPFQSTGLWEDANLFNTSSDFPFSNDYKNELWANAPISQIMLKYSGSNQINIWYTNTGQINCTSLASFFAGLNWAASGSDSSNAAYSGGRVKTLDITNKSINDPVFNSSARTKILFKFGEYDGAQDGNKDRSMIAGHRYDASDGVDAPWGLGTFTNLGGTVYYRDIVPVAENSNDTPPNSITGAPHAFSIWVKESPNFLGSYNNPASSGKAIKDAYAYATTGWYWLLVDGSRNLYWIDMDYDGGGWVLVANNRLNSGNIGTTAGTYAASTTGFITSGNYGVGSNPANFNMWAGLSKWNSIAAASGQRKFVHFVSSNIGCKLGLTAFHTKRAKWTWTGWSGTYAWQGVANYSLELGANSPGLYNYHIANGFSFTAYDLDQDVCGGNCAGSYGNTPFWYGCCWSGNLWGGGSGGSYADGPFWDGSASDYHNYGAYYIK